MSCACYRLWQKLATNQSSVQQHLDAACVLGRGATFAGRTWCNAVT